MSNRKCPECGWIGAIDKILTATSPFNPEDTVDGCPNCLDVVQFDQLCDEPGCNSVTSCGTPTPTGYRRTCRKHKPKEPEHEHE